MSATLWMCKKLDTMIMEFEHRLDEKKELLKKYLKRLSTNEFLQFGIDQGYDEATLEEYAKLRKK